MSEGCPILGLIVVIPASAFMISMALASVAAAIRETTAARKEK